MTPGPMTTNDHFERVVLPALREYVEAERALTAATNVGDTVSIEAAREAVMRRARTAAIELHQTADVEANQSTPPTPVESIRAAVQQHCTFLRDSVTVADIDLLRDVAEAFKHHTLDRKSARVTGADAMIASATGYSVLYFGEGKYGGAEQVIVTRKDGEQRALSSVLQNTADAWRRHLGRALPNINDYSA